MRFGFDFQLRPCAVCGLLDNDYREQECSYCPLCDAWICKADIPNLTRRAVAMYKRKKGKLYKTFDKMRHLKFMGFDYDGFAEILDSSFGGPGVAYPPLITNSPKLLVGSASNANPGTGNVVITYSPTANNFVGVWTSGSSPSLSLSVTDNATGGTSTYTTLISKVCSGGFDTCLFAYTCKVKSGVTTITIHNTLADDVAAVVVEVSGNLTSGCVDQSDTVGNTGTNAAPIGNPLSTQAAKEMVLGLFDVANSLVFSTSGVWTVAANMTHTHGGAGATGMSYQIVTTNSNYSPAATLSGSGSNGWTAFGVSVQ